MPAHRQAAADEFNHGWSVPGPDDRADAAVRYCPGGVLCETAIGDGGNGIWTVTDASDTIVAVFANFGLDKGASAAGNHAPH
jgi:hypothetical protein